MRVGTFDMQRRRTFNNILSQVEDSPTPATVVSETLVTESTSDLIQKCNWKLRKFMIRKVNNMAAEHGVDVDAGFGVRYVS